MAEQANGGGTALQRLLDAERQCAARIAAAERSSVEAVDAARAEMAALDAADEATLDEAAAALVRELETAHRLALDREREEASRLAAWYAGVPEDQVLSAAHRVVARVVGPPEVA